MDVEIASGPRYYDELEDIGEEKKKDKKERKRLAERGEGAALKNPTAVRDEKEEDGFVKVSGVW